jgi:phosphoglycolate phosphatase
MNGARFLFLDLDGTLLDAAPRYQRLHADLVAAAGGQPLAAAEYWDLKRRRTPEREILARTGISPTTAAEIAARRDLLIEDEAYLRLDQPWPWVSGVLAELSHLAPLALITLRRQRNHALAQLAALGLDRHFAHVLIGRSDGTAEAKAALALEIEPDPRSVLVGDTEVDVASGKALGFLTVAVTSGLRDAEHLAAAGPDVLLDDLRQLPAFLAARGWTPS